MSTPNRLTAATERIARGERIARRAEYRLTDDQIAVEIRKAVWSIRAMRAASEYERDALAAMVWEKLLAAKVPPTLTADDTGRAWFRATAAALVRQSRAWRDTVESYATRAAVRDAAHKVKTPVVAFDYSDDVALSELENQYASKLAEHAHNLAHAELAPASADLPSIAADALTLLGATLTEAQRRYATAAMIRIGAVAAGHDPTDALAALALGTGRSVAACKTDASRGADLLRDYPRAALAEAWTAAARCYAHLDAEAREDRPTVVNPARIAAGCARTRATAADVIAADHAVTAVALAAGDRMLALDTAASTRALRSAFGGTPSAWVGLPTMGRVIERDRAIGTGRKMPARAERRGEWMTCKSVGGNRGRGVVAYIAAAERAEAERYAYGKRNAEIAERAERTAAEATAPTATAE